MAIPPWFVRGAALRQRWVFARPYVIEREGFGQGGDCARRTSGRGPWSRHCWGLRRQDKPAPRKFERPGKLRRSKQRPYPAGRSRVGRRRWSVNGKVKGAHPARAGRLQQSQNLGLATLFWNFPGGAAEYV